MPILYGLGLTIGLVVLAWLVWRIVRFPCPSRLAWLLDNPFTRDYHARAVSQLDLAEGLAVLDAGCGPGRLTVPIAQAVGPRGRVLALDIQASMILQAKSRVADAGLTIVDFLCAALGAGGLPEATYDRALKVTLRVVRQAAAPCSPGWFSGDGQRRDLAGLHCKSRQAPR
jgi:SAM-dependent methyltransferase